MMAVACFTTSKGEGTEPCCDIKTMAMGCSTNLLGDSSIIKETRYRLLGAVVDSNICRWLIVAIMSAHVKLESAHINIISVSFI